MFRTIPVVRRTPFLLRRPLSSGSNFASPRLFSLPTPASTTSTSTLLRRAPTLTFRLQGKVLARGAASQVAGRPGSQTAEHAAENIKEEVGNSAADLAKSIAGSNLYADAVEPSQRTFVRRPAFAGDHLDIDGRLSLESRTQSRIRFLSRIWSSVLQAAFHMSGRR